MLELITVMSASAGTAAVLLRADTLSAKGMRCTVIVPEQISFEYERALCAALPETRQELVSVKSFRALCGDIFKKYGGGTKQRADAAAKLALMRRAVTAAGSAVEFYRRHSHTTAFYALMCDTVDELKRSGITPENLESMAQGITDQRAKRARFSETALIYAAYEALLKQKYTDDAGELQDAQALCAQGEFSDRAVLLDGFDGFSHGELCMVERMLSDGALVCCALGAETPFEASVPPAQWVPARTARVLIAAAKNAGVPYKTAEAAPQKDETASGISQLSRALQRGGTVNSTEGLSLFAPKNRREELSWVCAEILRLVREQGFSFSQIAVLANDMDGYSSAIKSAFEDYEIPYFCDFHSDLLCTPLVVMAQSLLKIAAWGLTSETVLEIAKSPLCGLDPDDADALENYAFVWGTEYSAWKKPFTGSPQGYSAVGKEDMQTLERIEAARAFVVDTALDFVQKLKQGGGENVPQLLYAACERLGARQRVEQASKQGTAEADELVRRFNLGARVFETLAAVLRDEAVTAEDLQALLVGQAGAVKLYDVPNTLDSVLVGHAPRTRAFGVRAAFVLGVNEGTFPSFETPAKLLTDSDRDYIEQCGYEIQTTFEARYYLELTYFCRALALPSQLLYISAPQFDTQGGPLMLTGLIKNALGGKAGEITRTVSAWKQCCTPASALAQLSRAWSRPGDDYETLRLALSLAGLGDTARRFAELAGQRPFGAASVQLCEQYFGSGIQVSPTVVNDFYGCRFKYFMRDVMRVRPLRQAQLTPVESGSYIHFVLEKVLKSLGREIESASPETLRKHVCDAADSYVEQYMGGYDANSPRVRYISERLKNQLFRLVSHIAEEQRQSEFKTEYFELGVGGDKSAPSRTLYTPEHKAVSVRGIIDRVDVLRRDGREYIRVVDYKTAGKEFSLTNVYYGLDIQMLAYMFILCDPADRLFENPSPAGVLYMPADPSLAQTPEKRYVMDGLLIDDRRLLDAMEPQAQGLFIPAKGGTGKKLVSLEELGRIRTHIDTLLVDMAHSVYSGSFEAKPLLEEDLSGVCDYCDYSAVCARFADRTAREKEKDKTAQLLGREQPESEKEGEDGR